MKISSSDIEKCNGRRNVPHKFRPGEWPNTLCAAHRKQGGRTRWNSPQTERDRRWEASVGRRAFLAPEQRVVEAWWTGGDAREEEGVVEVGGQSQVVAARRAKGDEGGHWPCPLWPKYSPNLRLVWGEMGSLEENGTDTGLEAALDTVFGLAMSVWTKSNRWEGFRTNIGDANPSCKLSTQAGCPVHLHC
jgi:hypothetical protein